jgi:predicted  nucleic acid-binding Zn-ribbon protein
MPKKPLDRLKDADKEVRKLVGRLTGKERKRKNEIDQLERLKDRMDEMSDAVDERLKKLRNKD